MRLFPYREFEIKGTNSSDSVASNLEKITILRDDGANYGFKYKEKYFRGTIVNDEFSLTPRGLAGSRRLTRPHIEGIIIEESDGVALKGTMKSDKLTKGFIIVALLFVLFALIGNEFPAIFILVAFPLAIWIFTGVLKLFFKLNASFIEDIFEKVVNREDLDPVQIIKDL